MPLPYHADRPDLTFDEVLSRDLERKGDPASLVAPRRTAKGTLPPGPVSAQAQDDSARVPTQVARAGIWGLSGRAVLMLANLGATPFTIRLLGPSAYGLWALIQAILLWVNPAEIGMGVATTKYGAERYALGDAAGEAKVVWSGLAVTLATTSLVGAALALIAHPLLAMLHVRGNALIAGTWALRLTAATFVVTQLVGVVNTSQQVRLRWRQYTFIYTLTNLIGAVGVPVAIYVFSGGVTVAAAVGLVASLLFLVSLSWDSLRLQPALRYPRADRTTLRELVTYGGPYALVAVAAIPLGTGERFFLSANASTTALAYYAVAMTVATTLQVLPEQLQAPLMPALTRLHAGGHHEEHEALYRKSLSGLYLVLTPATIIVALLARPFLTLWAGTTYGSHGTILLLVALAGVWANALEWVPWSYMLSAGKTKTLALLQGAELGPYLATAWFLTNRYGALGAAIVWSARLVLEAVTLFAITGRSYHLPVLPLSERRVRSVVAPALFGLACLVAASMTGGLLARSAVAAALLAVYVVAMWWLVMTRSERHGVSNLLCDMLGLPPRRRPAHSR